jgi:uncharacterized protein (TIGR02996 family)
MSKEKIREYQAFLKALANDPYDQETRLVFADWLEEHGLDDEAAEQRAWRREKQEAEDWLRFFAPKLEMTYKELLEVGEDIAQSGEYCFGDGEAPYLMQHNWEDFLKHWKNLTGSDAPDEPGRETRFRCAC